MKTRSILSALLGLALMAGGCASDEFERGGVSPTSPGVHVRLTGAAAPAARTRATVEATDGERTVNSVLAVLFDTHEGFYKTVPATRVGETDEYTFIVEKDATYDIWLVANASDELRSALEGIEPGTPMENAEGVSCLESIVAGQAPDADGQFLMVSKYSEKVTTRITETQSVGEVHMIRLAARFDLLNKAEGVTVKSITFKNRTVRSAVLTPNTMPTQTDWYEETPYEVNVTGDPENGNPWEEHIYTYENNSVAGDFMRPELTITYTEGDDSQVKTHTVELVDPNSTAGTAMAVKRNNLYRIILTKATKLDFDLEVLDWEEADAIENPDLPLVLPKNVQDSLNRQLLVYDLFTEFNVKELDLSNKKVVSFYDKITDDPEDLPLTAFHTFINLYNNNLVQNGAIITDDSGNKYRLPTVGEVTLLLPIITTILPEDKLHYSDNGSLLNTSPIFSGNNIYDGYFTEDVFLKNNDDNTVLNTVDISTESEFGFSGLSQLKKGRETGETLFWRSSDEVLLDIPETGAEIRRLTPVYGIRFKGTNQYAAYRWETKRIANTFNRRYISIKIKALPQDSNIEINDIVDNASFWKDGYIEISFPCSGQHNGKSGDFASTYGRIGEAGYFLTSSLYTANFINNKPTNGSRSYVAATWITSTCVWQRLITYCNPIRLVKVKESEAENQK